MSKLYLGHALNSDYQALYEQAVTELSRYGRKQDRYYCRRLDRYVSEQEVQEVASLERTLDALERGADKECILHLMNTNLPDSIDRSVHARYVTEIVRIVETGGVEIIHPGNPLQAYLDEEKRRLNIARDNGEE